MLKISKIWLVIGLTFFIISCGKNPPQISTIKGGTMGTYYQVKYLLTDKQIMDQKFSPEKIQSLIEEKLNLVNDQMSTYRPNSELSLLNKATLSANVSTPVIKVIKTAIDLYDKTDGSYDITIGPLVNIWGFGPEGRPNKVPNIDAIIAAKAKIGTKHIKIDGNTIYKEIPELYIDLSSIAKGYGVDLVAETIEKLGIDNYLVDIGGELRAKGKKPNNQNWKIAIESPNTEQGVERVIKIEDFSIATSGDYRNYFEENGIRYSHTIDPKTGRSITHKLVSVTVIDKECMKADGLATAITVLGPIKGLEFAKKYHIPVFLLIKDGTDFIESYTKEFEKFFVK